MLDEDSLKPRRYSLPNSDHELVFTSAALKVFANYRQLSSQPEAGGLLLATFELPKICVASATPPDISDKRWWTQFMPNRMLHRRVVRNAFSRGLHYIGEWHTHPEANPTPSSIDLASMSDAFQKSQHELNLFILVIVGNQIDRLTLSVTAHNAAAHYVLVESSCTGTATDT